MIENANLYSVQVDPSSPKSSSRHGGSLAIGKGGGSGGGAGRGRGQLIFYKHGDVGHYACDCTNPARKSCRYCRQFYHVIEDCPILISKM